MNIVFLDAKTIGDDIDLSGYDKLGNVIKYDFSYLLDREYKNINRSCV